MKFYTLALFYFSTVSLLAQPAINYAVQAWAEINPSTPSIKIQWKGISDAESYVIYKKPKNQQFWSSPIVTLDGTTQTYEDSNVQQGVAYEYRIDKLGATNGYGYLSTGIELPPVHALGHILLLIEQNAADSLSSELQNLRSDLMGDGWTVATMLLHSDESATEIKQKIIEHNFNTIGGIQSIYCIGHVPVPYSGNAAPDGHANNHEGAWPADGYYADLLGNWTDNVVNNVTAGQQRNHNIPNDGKFDQTYFPTPVEAEIGRVDFHNMPAFEKTEFQLLKNYLEKAHNFRLGNTQVLMKGVIDDNFGGFNGEAFAASAWKCLAPLVHPDNLEAGDYRTSLDSLNYIWSYGCGAGSYTSCNGVGNTNQFATDSLRGIFSNLFGSYFGDWDAQNNLMRAALAQGNLLSCVWNGRPHWNFHHMGMGDPIGYSAKISMNNDGNLYNTPLTFLARLVCMGLMGDPSLKMYIVPPVDEIKIDYADNEVNVLWEDTAQADNGYYVYRTNNLTYPFELLNEQALDAPFYTDACLEESGKYYYMVRASKLETTPSGSFYNLSTGIIDSVEIEVVKPLAIFDSELLFNRFTALNISTNASSYIWDFGDGTTSTETNPTHLYEENGIYTIRLIASNECFSDTLELSLDIMLSSTLDLNALGISISPNPFDKNFKLNFDGRSVKAVSVRNLLGHLIYHYPLQESQNEVFIQSDSWDSGTYLIQINDGIKSYTAKLIKV